MSESGFVVNDFIFDAQSENFNQLVLQNSSKGPVLVHFWSPKAGPSFRLYSVLEKMVGEYKGSFLLINLNVDENKSLAREYSITSIPTLKLFVEEQVAETLFGYQHESDLRFLLDQYAASENDAIIQKALTLYQQGEQETAYQQLGKAALLNPDYYKIPLTIATLMVQEGRIDEALTLLESMPEGMRQKAPCKRLYIQCEFAQMASPVSDIEQLKPFVRDNMHELPAVLLLAASYADLQQYSSALELFHHILQQDSNFSDGVARRSMIKILTLLQDDDPQLRFYRDVLRSN
jgi:putative thioredoxin